MTHAQLPENWETYVRPGAFIDLLSETLGEPRKTVVVIDRSLAVAGLRTQSGRGLSASRITAEDAATLLLSVMVASVATRAHEIAVVWCNLAGFGAPPTPTPGLEDVIPDWPGLRLHYAIEKLIRIDPAQYENAQVELKLNTKDLIARLMIRKDGIESVANFAPHADVLFEQLRRFRQPGDLQRTATISGETFRALNRAVAGTVRDE